MRKRKCLTRRYESCTIRLESEVQMSNYIVVGGGWFATSGTGEKFIRIKFKSDVPGNTTYNMWKNKEKKSDKHPDFFIKAMVPVDEGNNDPIF